MYLIGVSAHKPVWCSFNISKYEKNTKAAHSVFCGEIWTAHLYADMPEIG